MKNTKIIKLIIHFKLVIYTYRFNSEYISYILSQIYSSITAVTYCYILICLLDSFFTIHLYCVDE